MCDGVERFCEGRKKRARHFGSFVREHNCVLSRTKRTPSWNMHGVKFEKLFDPARKTQRRVLEERGKEGGRRMKEERGRKRI